MCSLCGINEPITKSRAMSIASSMMDYLHKTLGSNGRKGHLCQPSQMPESFIHGVVLTRDGLS